MKKVTLTPEMKKRLIYAIPLTLLFYVANKLSCLVRLSPGEGIHKLINALSDLSGLFASPVPSFNSVDLLVGLGCAGVVFGMVLSKHKEARKYRQDVEYGSARWGNAADIKPYMDSDPMKNVILSQTEGLMMGSRPKNPKYARNKNVLVIGGSGSGKTRFWLKPNLMQLHSSYVITDPKGTLVLECGNMLLRAKYRLKIFNTINMSKSMHYNPFAHLHSEKDILKLVNTLIVNTKGEGDKAGEDFWVKSERLLYTAYIAYIHFEAPEEEQNFGTLLEMLNASEVREDDETF